MTLDTMHFLGDLLVKQSFDVRQHGAPCLPLKRDEH